MKSFNKTTCLIIAVTAIILNLHNVLHAASSSPDTSERIPKETLFKALENDPYNINALRGLYSISVDSDNENEAVYFKKRLIEASRKTDNISDKLLVYSFLGQNFLRHNNYDSAIVFLKTGYKIWQNAVENGEKIEDTTPMNKIFNGLALYAINRELDYEKATDYLIQGLSNAEQNGNEYDYAAMGFNLVATYFIRNDAVGLDEALKIYNYGQTKKNEYIKFVGAYGCGIMYYFTKDIRNAEKYITEAIGLMGETVPKAGVYTIYANILSDKGENAKAEEYYNKALEVAGTSTTQTATNTYTYLSYGLFLSKNKRFTEAKNTLQKGLRISDSLSIYTFSYQLYKAMSDIYRMTGDWKNAYDYHTRFHDSYATTFNMQKEKAINELTLKYETAQNEKKLKEHQVEIVKKDKLIITMVFIVAIILLGLLALYIMYRHKNNMYLHIAKQYKESIEMGKRTELPAAMKSDNSDETAREEDPDGKKHTTSSLSQDKSRELFNTLDELMRSKKLYRDSNIGRERLAEMISTNRTYLTQIISDNTGKSLSQYLNSYRIADALATLSDVNDETPLKAISSDNGFNSLTTFYKVFRDEVGMTPAKYREKIIELSRK